MWEGGVAAVIDRPDPDDSAVLRNVVQNGVRSTSTRYPAGARAACESAVSRLASFDTCASVQAESNGSTQAISGIRRLAFTFGLTVVGS